MENRVVRGRAYRRNGHFLHIGRRVGRFEGSHRAADKGRRAGANGDG